MSEFSAQELSIRTGRGLGECIDYLFGGSTRINSIKEMADAIPEAKATRAARLPKPTPAPAKAPAPAPALPKPAAKKAATKRKPRK